MPPSIFSSILIPLSSLIIFLSSIAAIAARFTSITSYNDATCYGECKHSVAMLEDVPEEFLLLGIYPAHLGLDASTLVLVAAHVALVVSGGVGVGWGVVRRRGRGICLPKPRAMFLLSILLTTTALSFSALITSLALHAHSSHFHLTYRSPAGGFGFPNSYDNGVFDLESWTCATKDLKSMRYYPELGRQCVAEKTGRVCVVLVAVFSVLLFGAVGWDVRMGGGFIVIKGKEGVVGEKEIGKEEVEECGVNEGEGWRQFRAGKSETGEKTRYG